MKYRKQVRTDRTEAANVLYMNRFAQIMKLVSPRNCYAELGRGSSKTTDFLTERLLDVVYDMPGAPCAWVSDTFTNLTQNVIPTVLESLERKGYHENVHYVVEKEPPKYSESEKSDLPEWLRDHFWHPRNKLITYRRSIIFFTGTNLTFGSLDRPSTLAGRSFVHLFGDEAKYFQESKISTMLKAVRGYPEYSSSVFYRGVTFTSDVADPSHIGEYDWLSKFASRMDMEAILLVMRAGLVYHECLREYLAAKDDWLKIPSEANRSKTEKLLAVANRWGTRWKSLRMRDEAGSFYLRASSFVNADILTPEWFADAMDGKAPDLKTAILSMRAGVASGEKFYASLTEANFYKDGVDEGAYDKFSLRDREDCTVLKYLDMGRPLCLGVDFGNMCSMVVGQDGRFGGRECIRALKFLYTLAPEHVEELGAKFRAYFSPMTCRTVQMYYDRAGNQYSKVGKSHVEGLKRAIEVDPDTGRRTGWTVQLMNLGQGAIPQDEEYTFMMKILKGSSYSLPLILIDYYQCKPLRLSLQNARTKVKEGRIHKDKSSERLPTEELPLHSTNPSDAFKYFLMRKRLRERARDKTGAPLGNDDPAFSVPGTVMGRYDSP